MREVQSGLSSDMNDQRAVMNVQRRVMNDQDASHERIRAAS
jgi:hypothetical protein